MSQPGDRSDERGAVAEAAAPPARAPGRPRSAEADVAIQRAALEELAESGYRAFSMERVRARAGVGKATIYRRYGSKDELVKDAVRYLHAEMPVPHDTGSLMGDVAELVRGARSSYEAVNAPLFMPQLMADSANDPDMQPIFFEHLVAPRRRATAEVFVRARARGEIRDDLDLELLVDMFTGPIIYRLLIGAKLEEIVARPQQVIETLLDGIRPR